MAKKRHLNNPPITEAIVDFKVEHADPPTAEQLLKLHDGIKIQYPKKQTRRLWSGQIGLGAEGPKVSTQEAGRINGYGFQSQDPPQVVVYQDSGISFSRLRPYTSWEEIIPEFRRHWERYAGATKPRSIVRVASRFINAIEIPLGTIDLEEYFEAPPKTPPGAPAETEEFLQRLIIPYRDVGLKAIVTLATGRSGTPNSIKIILDIDVVCRDRFEIDDPSVWDVLQKIRDTKNDIFFESLKEKAIALFEDGVKK